MKKFELGKIYYNVPSDMLYVVDGRLGERGITLINEGWLEMISTFRIGDELPYYIVELEF